MGYNDLKVSELVTSKMAASDWDPNKVVDMVGRAGHISLEVHNNAPGDWLGNDRSLLVTGFLTCKIWTHANFHGLAAAGRL